jgi:hypothetical protein
MGKHIRAGCGGRTLACFAAFFMLFFAAVSPAGQAGPDAPFYATAVFPVEGEISDLVPADFNHDGLCDFAVASHFDHGRRLSFFIQTQNGFSYKPHSILPLKSGEIVFQAVDVDRDGALELVFLCETGVFLKTWSVDSGFTAWIPLVVTQSALPLADDARTVQWTFVRDIDSDGLCEILIPKNRWMEVYSRNGDGTCRLSRRLWISPAASLDPSPGGLTVLIALPHMEMSDFNGDGIRDLVCILGNRMDVFLQHPGQPGGGALIPPDLRFAFETRGEKSFSLQTADFNGDGRMDAAEIIDDRSIRVHLNKRGRFDPVPDRVFSADGISFGHAVRDFNGDGLADVAFIELGLGVKSLTQFVLFQKYQRVLACTFGRADDGQAARPDFTMAFKQKFRLNDPLGRNAFWSFDGDFNGDGVNDLAVGSSPETIEFFWGLPGGGFVKKAGAAVGAAGSEKYRMQDVNGDGITDAFFWYPDRSGVVLLLSRKAR